MRIAVVTECSLLVAGLRTLRPDDQVVQTRLIDLNSIQADVAIIDVESEFCNGAITDLKKIDGHNIMLYGGMIPAPMCRIAVNNGVKAAVLKSAPEAELNRVISTVSGGNVCWDKETLMYLMSTRTVALTNREGDLCSLVGMGLANKEIGARLHISEGTVKVYLSRLFSKLQVSSRWELSAWVRSNFLASTAHASSPVPKPNLLAVTQKQ